MNRRTAGLTISQAIGGFVKYKVVWGLSERTLESYQKHLNRFHGRVGDVHRFDHAGKAGRLCRY